MTEMERGRFMISVCLVENAGEVEELLYFCPETVMIGLFVVLSVANFFMRPSWWARL